MLRGIDLNYRPLGYEPSELPLFYPAKNGTRLKLLVPASHLYIIGKYVNVSAEIRMPCHTALNTIRSHNTSECVTPIINRTLGERKFFFYVV